MKRILIYFIIIIVAFLLQTSILSWMPFVAATPNLILITVFSFGFMKGEIVGTIAGAFAGILFDIFHGDLLGFYTFIFIIMGYANGKISKNYYSEYIDFPLLLCMINNTIYGMYIYVFRFLLRGRLNLFYYIFHIIFPEVVFTLVVTLFVYRFILFIDNKLGTKERNDFV
jgi:rod shape-determining protein MreD